MAVFANKLRKLGRESTGLKHVVKLAFVTRLPDGVLIELQQEQGVEYLSVVDLLGRGRGACGKPSYECSGRGALRS